MPVGELPTRPTTAGSAAPLTYHAEQPEVEYALAQHAGEKSPPYAGQVAIPDSPLTPKTLDDSEEDWQHDPINPRNWSRLRKYLNMSVVSLYTFISPLSSSMMSPALPEIALHYGITDQAIIALTLTIFLLSFALAPLIIAPLSEIYGRKWIYHIGNLMSLAFSLGCAFAPSTASLIAFRFLGGASGAVPVALGSGSVTDLFSERDRASAMAMYTLGPLLGPVVGPIIGGFVTESIGFKYVFVVLAGFCGVGSLLAIPILRETYAPVIRCRQKPGDPEKAGILHPHLLGDNGSIFTMLWTSFSRPVILLTRSFLCFILSLYMALMYSVYYLMFTTFPTLFTDIYGFSLGSTGLAYLGLGLGFMLATIFCASISDHIYARLVAQNNGVGKPEFRIPSLIFGSLFVPVGLFWYGWSAQAKIHWIMPIMGTGIFGFGVMTTFIPISLYLADSFTYTASAVAAASVFRCLLGFAFPLFGSQMYAVLGNGGANSLLAGLMIVVGIPFPIWIWYKGEKIRLRSSLNR